MRQKLTLVPLLLAWLFATGSHWDLVQVFAWGRMITSYSQNMSFAEAVRTTFDANNLCSLCKEVSEAKKQEQSPQAAPKSLEKILLVFEPASAFIISAGNFSRKSFSNRELLSAEPAAPPSPPPRSLV